MSTKLIAALERIQKPNQDPLDYLAFTIRTDDEEFSLHAANLRDEYAREAALYSQAYTTLDAVMPVFEKKKVQFFAPEEFFSEKMKSKKLMDSILEKKMLEKAEIEQKEAARHRREMIKNGKKIQRKKLMEKTKKEKESMKKIEEWKKERIHAEKSGKDEKTLKKIDEKILNEKSTFSVQKNKKREMKNRKYGPVDKAKRSKKNTSASTWKLAKGEKIRGSRFQ